MGEISSVVFCEKKVRLVNDSEYVKWYNEDRRQRYERESGTMWSYI